MRTVGGLDLARRADFSALVTLAVDARQATVTRALRLPQRAYASQIQAIAPILAGLDRLAFDAGGVGDAVGELLPASAIPVLIVAGDGVSRRNGRWHIGKTRLIGDLLHLARAGRLIVAPNCPGAEALRSEMVTFTSAPTRQGVRLEARGKAHDDLVLALALAVLAARFGAKMGVKVGRRSVPLAK